MQYERRTINKSDERDIITGMIVSTEFLRGVRPLYKPDLFTLRYARTVAKWCVEYYDEYECAPESNMRSLFEGNKLAIRSEEDVEIIDTFLESLSEQYAESDSGFNVDYEVKKAVQYFKGVSLDILTDQIRSCRLTNDYTKAEALIATYQRIERGSSSGVDVIRDTAAAADAVRSDTDDILFHLPGELGKMVRPIKKNDFVAIIAPAKRGKCLMSHSEILLSDGRLKRIEDVVSRKHNRIVSLNENTQKFEEQIISEFQDNGSKNVYLLKTRTGRELFLTKEHPVLSFTGWEKLSEITPGNRIAVPRRIDFFGKNNMSAFLVKILAYLIADGGVTNGIVFTKKNEEVMHDFLYCVVMEGDNYKYRSDKISVTLSKGVIRKKLVGIGFKFCKSIKKEIPDIIFTLKKEQVKIFLQTLFTCDGSISKYKNGINIDYSSGSKVLIHQVQHLLLRFGIISTLREKIVDGTTYYRLDIRDSDNVDLFLDEIGFLFHKKEKSEKLLVEMKRKRSGMSFIDCFPYEMKEVVSKEIKHWQKRNNFSYKDACKHRCIDQFLSEKYRKCNVNRMIVEDINKIINSPVLKIHLDSDIMWDEVVSITPAGKSRVYDLSLPRHHNFVANDIVVHNSWWLGEFGFLGMMNHLNILFLSGEMPSTQMLIRLYQRMNGELEPSDNEYSTEEQIDIPYFDNNYKMNGIVNYRKEIKSRLSSRSVVRKLESLETFTKSKKFHLECFPAGSMNVKGGIIPLLDNLEHYEKFVPELIVLDYADILGSERGGERRHQIDETWQALRGLGQDRNIAMITASHSNKATFDRDIRQSDLSEDNRKLNHVTLGIALNQNEDDEEKGIMRVSVIADRYRRFSKSTEAVVLHCLDIGRPYLDSRVVKKEF